jgi:hypothetical protein
MTEGLDEVVPESADSLRRAVRAPFTPMPAGMNAMAGNGRDRCTETAFDTALCAFRPPFASAGNTALSQDRGSFACGA